MVTERVGPAARIQRSSSVPGFTCRHPLMRSIAAVEVAQIELVDLNAVDTSHVTAGTVGRRSRARSARRACRPVTGFSSTPTAWSNDEEARYPRRTSTG